MATFKVTFEITVTEGHPRKWVPEAVGDALQTGEFTDNWVFEEITPEVSEEN